MKRTTSANADQYIAALESFKTSGSLWGTDQPLYEGLTHGRLPQEHRAALTNAWVEDAVIYIVFSYSTPIAWMLKDGSTVIPDVKYSPTTSAHQSIVRRVWS